MGNICFALILMSALSMVQGSISMVFGQENKVDVGIVGSPGLIFLRGNEIIRDAHEPALGFSGGMSFQYSFHRIFSFHTDLQFERKGSVVPILVPGSGSNPTLVEKNIHINFNYLTVPLLLRMIYGQKARFFANAGPFCGYLFKQTVVFPPGLILPDGSGKEDNTKNDKRIDLGATAGFGIGLPWKEKFLFSFEVRGNLGLFNVSAVPVYDNGTIKTFSSNFLIGFVYKLNPGKADPKE